MQQKNMVKLLSVNIQKQPPEMLCKKGVLRNFTKFPGKYLCQSLFLKNTLLKKQLYLKKDSGTGVFL